MAIKLKNIRLAKAGKVQQDKDFEILLNVERHPSGAADGAGKVALACSALGYKIEPESVDVAISAGKNSAEVKERVRIVGPAGAAAIVIRGKALEEHSLTVEIAS